MSKPVPLPPRKSMLEVAEYLDALVSRSGFLGAVAVRAVSKMLRQRAADAPERACGGIVR